MKLVLFLKKDTECILPHLTLHNDQYIAQMRRVTMVLRRRFIQFIAGATVLIFYVQFQLLSYTDRRLFLKRMSLALPHLSGSSTAKKLDKVCAHYRTSPASHHGFSLLSWTSTYITDLKSFKDYPLFPKHPDSVQFNMKASLRLPKPVSTSGWLFGLLFVPQTGDYRFALSTNGEAELRVSRNAEPEKTRVLASLTSSETPPKPGEYNKYSKQTSVSVFLQKCKAYYVEVLFHTQTKNSHVELAWETPNSLKYELIPLQYLSPYIGTLDFAHTGDNLVIFEDNFKMSSLFSYISRQKHSVENENMDQWSRLPYMLSTHARNLPKCLENFKGYEPSSRLVIPKINSKSTEKFVNDYTKRLVEGSNGKYTFRGIHYAEEKSLGETGTRYLMNVEFEDNIMETRIRVSEYMFYENQNRHLCFVDDFTWKRDAMITIIAVIPNMEIWSHYFMDHLSAMTRRLQDARFSVIIAASQGLREYFQTIVTQNTLAWHSHVTLLLMNAKEIQSMEAIMKAVLARIPSHDTIIFFTDIRVQLPLKALEHVRKRTIEGKTVYVPWPENFDKGFVNNATMISPLDKTNSDRPPSFAVHVSDLIKLIGQKTTRKRYTARTVWKSGWWKDLVNGAALEVYLSKMPKFYYFQPEKA